MAVLICWRTNISEFLILLYTIYFVTLRAMSLWLGPTYPKKSAGSDLNFELYKTCHIRPTA